jgi:hypothetical protein
MYVDARVMVSFTRGQRAGSRPNNCGVFQGYWPCEKFLEQRVWVVFAVTGINTSMSVSWRITGVLDTDILSLLNVTALSARV